MSKKIDIPPPPPNATKRVSTLPLINQSRKKTSQYQAHEWAEHPNPCLKYLSFLIHLFFLTFVNQTPAWTKQG